MKKRKQWGEEHIISKPFMRWFFDIYKIVSVRTISHFELFSFLVLYIKEINFEKFFRASSEDLCTLSGGASFCRKGHHVLHGQSLRGLDVLQVNLIIHMLLSSWIDSPALKAENIYVLWWNTLRVAIVPIYWKIWDHSLRIWQGKLINLYSIEVSL